MVPTILNRNEFEHTNELGKKKSFFFPAQGPPGWGSLKEEVIFFIQSVTLFWWGFWYSRVWELAKYHYSMLTMNRWLAQLLLAAPGEHFKVEA